MLSNLTPFPTFWPCVANIYFIIINRQKARVVEYLTYATSFGERNGLVNFIPCTKK